MSTFLIWTVVFSVVYLFYTGLAWILFWLINSAFGLSIHPNIWLVGILLFIIVRLFLKK